MGREKGPEVNFFKSSSIGEMKRNRQKGPLGPF